MRKSLPKIKAIEDYYGLSMDKLIIKLYQNEKKSSLEIQEKLKEETGQLVSPRAIQMRIKNLGIGRTLSEAFLLVISSGRKSYDNLRKPIKTSESRRGISLGTRYATLKRDNFKCVLCGATATDSQLVIDHIVPILKSGTNDLTNLRVLCRPCNHGKMIHEHEK